MKKIFSFLTIALLLVFTLQISAADIRQTATTFDKKANAVFPVSAPDAQAEKQMRVPLLMTLTFDKNAATGAGNISSANYQTRFVFENKRKFAFNDYPLLS